MADKLREFHAWRQSNFPVSYSGEADLQKVYLVGFDKAMELVPYTGLDANLKKIINRDIRCK